MPGLLDVARHAAGAMATLNFLVALAIEYNPGRPAHSDLDTEALASAESAPNVELHHPGHPPIHVTRLRRHDHGGLDSFIEAEEAWARQEPPEQNQFFKVSAPQLAVLLEHQRIEREASRVGAEGGDRAGPANVEGSTLSQLRYRTPGHNDMTAVIRLNSLSSQYVGPIKVGTRLEPEGCNQPVLQYLPGEALAEAAIGERTCHAVGESEVWVVFDTGSTNIWVASDLCEVGPCVMPDRHRYNHQRSITWHPPEMGVELAVQFGTGKISGPHGVDDFHVGPFTVYNQTFGMIKTEEGDVFQGIPFEGILGLAWPSMSANNVRAFFDTVIADQALERNEFAFYLHPSSRAANAVFWGGVDKSFYKGDLEYFPVVDPYYWSLHLAHFKIGDRVLLEESHVDAAPAGSLIEDHAIRKGLQHSEPGRRENWRRGPFAIVDSGTTYFTAEEKLYQQVMSLLQSGPCDKVVKSNPTIEFGLKNMLGEVKTFAFSPNQYLVETADHQCMPSFMKIDIPSAHGPGMVLGETFLRNYFTVFDRGDGGLISGRVGIAPSKHDDEVLNQLRRLTGGEPTFSTRQS